MINVIVDGNYIFHKTFGVFAGYDKNIDPGKILKNKSDQSSFIRKVSTDLCAALKLIPYDGKLVFVTDSRSWRKDIEIENGGYKSGRIKDETVDWTIFFELLTAFGDQLEKMGFIFSKVEGAEGDDLLLYWSDYFKARGENSLILTGDHDMYQLARMSDDSWIVVWNNNSKKNIIAVPMGWKDEWLEKSEIVETIDIFNMGSSILSDRSQFREFLKNIKIDEIDDRAFIFNKILIGDDGDTVPSVWEYKTNIGLENEKLIRFTPKKAETVYNAFLLSEWKNLEFAELMDDKEFLNWAAGLILRISKDVANSNNIVKVKVNIVRNFILMWLDQYVIPNFVADSIVNEINRADALEVKPVIIDRMKLLKGTDWVTEDYQPRQFNPFTFL
jgi:hypothetical protein